jgi:hypothetical protein
MQVKTTVRQQFASTGMSELLQKQSVKYTDDCIVLTHKHTQKVHVLVESHLKIESL